MFFFGSRYTLFQPAWRSLNACVCSVFVYCMVSNYYCADCIAFIWRKNILACNLFWIKWLCSKASASGLPTNSIPVIVKCIYIVCACGSNIASISSLEDEIILHWNMRSVVRAHAQFNFGVHVKLWISRMLSTNSPRRRNKTLFLQMLPHACS